MADVTMNPPGGKTGIEYNPESGVGTTGIERKMDELKPSAFEGKVTRRIEHQTAKVPSVFYLIAAGISVIGSVALFASRRPLTAIFVGLWPPTFLLLGNYNKMVKLVEENRGQGFGY